MKTAKELDQQAQRLADVLYRDADALVYDYTLAQLDQLHRDIASIYVDAQAASMPSACNDSAARQSAVILATLASDATARLKSAINIKLATE